MNGEEQIKDDQQTGKISEERLRQIKKRVMFKLRVIRTFNSLIKKQEIVKDAKYVSTMTEERKK